MWLGGINIVGENLEIDSPERCQLLCNATDGCNWFVWRDANVWNPARGNPTGCVLFDKKGADKSTSLGRDQGVTGPKKCIGEYKM